MSCCLNVHCLGWRAGVEQQLAAGGEQQQDSDSDEEEDQGEEEDASEAQPAGVGAGLQGVGLVDTVCTDVRWCVSSSPHLRARECCSAYIVFLCPLNWVLGLFKLLYQSQQSTGEHTPATRQNSASKVHIVHPWCRLTILLVLV